MARARDGREQVWIGARPTRAATALLVAIVAIYLSLLFLEEPVKPWIVSHFALLPRQALGPQPWQLLTSAFIHTHFGLLISDGFAIWIFATAVERRVGPRRMLALFVVAQLVGALVMAGLGRMSAAPFVFEGCSAPALALAMAFGVLYGGLPLKLFGIAEMKSITLAWLVVGASLVVSLLNRNWPGLTGDLAGVVCGWLAFSGMGVRLSLLWHQVKVRRSRRRYRVIPGGQDSSRRYWN